MTGIFVFFFLAFDRYVVEKRTRFDSVFWFRILRKYGKIARPNDGDISSDHFPCVFHQRFPTRGKITRARTRAHTRLVHGPS